MERYTVRDVQSLLGISRAAITRLIAAGLVTPTRGKRGEYRFGFQDVVTLRTAQSLRAAQISPRQVLRALQRLKALRNGQPLAGVRIAAVGNNVAVQEQDRQWLVETGQLLMDFEPKAPGGAVISIRGHAAEPPENAAYWFELGSELEHAHPKEAADAYRRAIRAAPDYVDAYLNLGCLLCEMERPAEAARLYADALSHLDSEPLLHFNLAVALEDLGRYADALASYDRCIALSPGLADAHFNAARLHQVLGDSQRAIRHFNQYRRLERKP